MQLQSIHDRLKSLQLLRARCGTYILKRYGEELYLWINRVPAAEGGGWRVSWNFENERFFNSADDTLEFVLNLAGRD